MTKVGALTPHCEQHNPAAHVVVGPHCPVAAGQLGLGVVPAVVVVVAAVVTVEVVVVVTGTGAATVGLSVGATVAMIEVVVVVVIGVVSTVEEVVVVTGFTATEGWTVGGVGATI